MKSSGMRREVTVKVRNICKDCGAFIFLVKQSKMTVAPWTFETVGTYAITQHHILNDLNLQ
jgi:hypothetical protein